MCTYNRANLLPGAIDAVLQQDDFELIVVDDGSSDDTRAVCAAHTDSRLRYIHTENGGLSAARNTGIEACSGDFIIFIDDDDRADAAWLLELATAVRSHPRPTEVGVVNCGRAGRRWRRHWPAEQSAKD